MCLEITYPRHSIIKIMSSSFTPDRQTDRQDPYQQGSSALAFRWVKKRLQNPPAQNFMHLRMCVVERSSCTRAHVNTCVYIKPLMRQCGCVILIIHHVLRLQCGRCLDNCTHPWGKHIDDCADSDLCNFEHTNGIHHYCQGIVSPLCSLSPFMYAYICVYILVYEYVCRNLCFEQHREFTVTGTELSVLCVLSLHTCMCMYYIYLYIHPCV